MATAARKRAPAKKTPNRAVVPTPTPPALQGGDKGLLTLARDLRSWTDFVLGIANTAADLSFRVATSRLTKPSHKAAVEKAGGLFRDLRESAGLTLGDLGRAINLKDVSLLEQVEAHGKRVGAKTTRGRVWVLVYAEKHRTRKGAMRREVMLKRDKKFRAALRK